MKDHFERFKIVFTLLLTNHQMDILSDIKFKRKPSKSMDDMLIPDQAWKPDFEIADRYQTFASEIMRIALLGIAGFGFLISEIAMKAYDKFCGKVEDLALIEALGIVFLGLSLACALAYRYYSTSCLYYQVLIGRSLLRFKNENSNWSEEELAEEKGYLNRAREMQKRKSANSSIILKLSTLFLVIGYLFIVIIFCAFLLNFAPANVSTH